MFLKLSKKKNQQALRRRVEGRKVRRAACWVETSPCSLCFVWLFLFCFSLEEIKVLCRLKISAEKSILTLVWKTDKWARVIFF